MTVSLSVCNSVCVYRRQRPWPICRGASWTVNLPSKLRRFDPETWLQRKFQPKLQQGTRESLFGDPNGIDLSNVDSRSVVFILSRQSRINQSSHAHSSFNKHYWTLPCPDVMVNISQDNIRQANVSKTQSFFFLHCPAWFYQTNLDLYPPPLLVINFPDTNRNRRTTVILSTIVKQNKSVCVVARRVRKRAWKK